jgi:glucose-6-phosphate isomerase
MLEKRDGVAAARKAIIATTDKARGALYTLAVSKKAMSASSIPDDIGGRYSVQTAVGLFPIACAGIDPREILAAAPLAAKIAPIRLWKPTKPIVTP